MKLKLPHIFICAFLSSITGVSQISFQDINSNFENDVTHGVVGGIGLGIGVSFVDYNNDGWDDISVPSSSTKDFQFLKNNQGVFEIDPLPISGGTNQARQISWVDTDNDGDLDFFATGDAGKIWFFKNDGNSEFTDVSLTSGFIENEVENWGNSWGDYDNDGFLDVFISVRDTDLINHNYLYKNNGDGSFTDVTQTALNDMNGYMSFCSSFFDYDRDGDLDIYVANDKEPTRNVLYSNNGDGTFADVSTASGTDLSMSAMSTTIDDYNNDGWLDIYVTNLYSSQISGEETVSNALLRNNGDGTFTDVAGASNTLFDSIGWGAVFLDADGDLDKDLYVSGSPDGTGSYASFAFYENRDLEIFIERDDAGFGDNAYKSMGNAIGDVENDGFPDIVVVNVDDEPINIWNNDYEGDNNWFKIKLEGVASNKMGIGALLEVTTGDTVQYNYTLCGEGFGSQNSRYEFFGLGANSTVDQLKINWPSGQVDTFEDISANQAVTAVEGEDLETLSTEGVSDDLLFSIYHTISESTLRIAFGTSVQDPLLALYTVSGQEVFREKTEVSISSKIIDISSFAPGVYILKVASANGLLSQKVIIN